MSLWKQDIIDLKIHPGFVHSIGAPDITRIYIYKT